MITSFIILVCLSSLNTIISVTTVNLRIVNHAGLPIELFWVNSLDNNQEIADESIVKLTSSPIPDTGSIDFTSYASHKFLVRYSNHVPGVEVSFTKNAEDESVTIVSNDDHTKLRIHYEIEYDDISEKVTHSTRKCSGMYKGKEFISCVAKDMMEDFNRLSESKSRLTVFRDRVSNHVRNYTCADPFMETSSPISHYEYTPSVNSDIPLSTYTVNVFLDMSHAKIWTIDNFVTDEECSILMTHGRPKLSRATVAAEDGSSIVSENRKAQQASYDLSKENDPLKPLYNRVLEMANHHTGYQLRPEGQESFTIIQYNVEDQYTPHCDSSCDGTKHHSGGRVATAVLYCKIADRGGATTFTKSDIFIKPKNNSVTFFSYMGPDGLMDPESLTEHSGCPVEEGEKWITTFWMREGVTAQDPWTMFDPSGVRMAYDYS